ncbi:MAG: translation elongation factor Tu [Candidatus Xenolissoclinum pacificiensis L6]|uniref:Elongation factor Tu n=1 Tax=Candidatus Xenolissoclinum pacificiensis L6 TaxID=1401685 RepID=W2UZ35_9RICK|nr:MAG: translation elongation factor Tu [Candidatus Xenolissoclinum pacificiensis L6]
MDVNPKNYFIVSLETDVYQGKEHMNIGTIGHVDHGKTTLTAAISQYSAKEFGGVAKSYADIDTAPEERARGITINIGHCDFLTANRHYGHTDCPGHADFIKNMITGAAPLDVAVLVVSATDGSMPQTREHLLLIKQMGIRDIVVYINKADVADQEMIELSELDIRDVCDTVGYEDVSVVVGSAFQALEEIGSGKEYTEVGALSIRRLLDAVDNIDMPERDEDSDFLMPIEKLQSIKGQGTVATGNVECGKLLKGTDVYIYGLRPDGEKPIKTTAIGLEAFKKSMGEIKAGDSVGILLRGMKRDELQRGQIISILDNLKCYKKFKVRVYLLTAAEGGRNTAFVKNYRPQAFIRTADVTVSVLKIEGVEEGGSSSGERDVALPGDDLFLTLSMEKSLPLHTGMKISLREGGRTVGSGSIIEVLSE